MKPSLRVEVASRPPAVRIALSGTLTSSGAARAVRACERVPRDVRVVHLDLRQLHLFDVSALDAVLSTLRRRGTGDCGVIVVTRPDYRRAP